MGYTSKAEAPSGSIIARWNTIAGMCNNRIESGNGGDTIAFGFIGGYNIWFDQGGCSNVSEFNAISKVTSTFRIHHPDPSKRLSHNLVHSTVESPTAGDNIYRFKTKTKNGVAKIDLPSYYKHLNCNDQVWVTPVDSFSHAWGSVNQNQTEINISSDSDAEFYVLLIGTRKDELGKRGWKGAENLIPSNLNGPEITKCGLEW